MGRIRKISGPVFTHKRLTEVERAYFAGFLDGSARFIGRIITHKDRVRKQVETTVMVYSGNLNAIQSLQRAFGGTVSLYNRKNKRRPLYVWHIKDKNQIADLARTLLPYMKAKKEQAQLLMEFCLSRLSKMNDVYPLPPITEEEKEMIRALTKLRRGTNGE